MLKALTVEKVGVNGWGAKNSFFRGTPNASKYSRLAAPTYKNDANFENKRRRAKRT